MTSILSQRHPSERSFERLYRAHVQDVYRYSLMLLRNRADAEDVAQTTFLKAYRAIQRGDRPRHPRKWLITIAHNTCRTRARDHGRRPQEVAFEEQLTEPAAPPEEPDVDIPELVRAFGALSFNQRAALVMRELEGRSYAEIADVLRVSGSAVDALLFRARRALREQLEGALTCGEAERALSMQLDGRLGSEARSRLRAHLRECGECASLARRQRARRAALRGLGPVPLPASLASWGGAAAGPGVAVKVAAVLAAGVAAAGTSQDGARAITEVAAAPRPVVAGHAAPVPRVPSVPPSSAPRERRAVAARPTAPVRTPLVPDRSPAPAPSPAAERTPVAVPAPAPAPAPPPPAPEPILRVDTAPVTDAVTEVAVPLPTVEVTVTVPELPVEVPPLLP